MRCLSSQKPLELLDSSLSFSFGGGTIFALECCAFCVVLFCLTDEKKNDVSYAARVVLHY